jgi:DNA gyrase/topoisomerase IV subunit A
LTGSNHKRIPIYLDRSSTRGGGSRSIVNIANDLFGQTYHTLSDDQKDLVLETQRTEHTWMNDLEKGRIFSLKCTKITSGTKDGTPSPCLNCLMLLKSDERLRYVLKKPVPHEKNFKFINFRFRNRKAGLQYARIKGFDKLLEEAVSHYSILFQHKLNQLNCSQNAENVSPFVKFAQGALEGKYDSDKVFLGLIQAMVEKVDRTERGVGMQNFAYAPAWDEFTHIVALHSPRAYQFLTKHFQARTLKSFRQVVIVFF